jgi:hypothetical protein
VAIRRLSPKSNLTAIKAQEELPFNHQHLQPCNSLLRQLPASDKLRLAQDKQGNDIPPKHETRLKQASILLENCEKPSSTSSYI